MSARSKTISLNLGGLGALLGALVGINLAMYGTLGAKYYANVLRTGSPKQRLDAANALADLRGSGTPAIAALLAALRNTDSPAAAASARALREINAQAAYEYAQDLTKRVERRDQALTPGAIAVFRSLGPIAWRAIPLLRPALHNPEHVRDLIPALIEMGDYGEALVAAIIEDSRDPIDSVKKWDAMLAFDQLGYRAVALRPELERLSADATPAVSGKAKMVLSNVANTAKYALSGLSHSIAGDQVQQEYALDQLSKQGAYAADAVPDVARQLESRSVLIRFLATWTLAHMGPPARAALPRLHRAEKDGASLVRDGAADAVRILETEP